MTQTYTLRCGCRKTEWKAGLCRKCFDQWVQLLADGKLPSSMARWFAGQIPGVTAPLMDGDTRSDGNEHDPSHDEQKPKAASNQKKPHDRGKLLTAFKAGEGRFLDMSVIDDLLRMPPQARQDALQSKKIEMRMGEMQAHSNSTPGWMWHSCSWGRRVDVPDSIWGCAHGLLSTGKTIRESKRT